MEDVSVQLSDSGEAWYIVELVEAGELHVLPYTEGREHERTECWCLPRIRSADDGTVRVLHNAEKDEEWPEVIL